MAHKTPTLTKEQRELIEQLGVANEKANLPPASARIMALLLVSPVVELPFEDISSMLNLSKSATSNALNHLLALERIEYVTHPGERRRYFRSRFSKWKTNVTEQLRSIEHAAQLLDKACAGRPANTPEFNAQLKELVDFMNYMVSELPGILARWEKRR
ncbi:MAG: MarR family transcriptional regulator [Flavobacteriales bacterium]|nr:MarR family transcriptional regulator [Flavobacteriales bacterium]